ncbi:type VI secretion system membrane subunit TssM [Xenorhabdus anantnagensis]|uniref:Type VI secretion system membrane subunit TssM n=1 Tax=Xenorhabdus anantnagensis TaxID=3025875 RepID=A0ABT5LP14_9GAMM|nr:type VI secretion system membrane subunit TssM [Xenorhabdus anantnagensis]MDC9596160.1 type VI secretion system membrane subunit TssM [Xenorhabdus anantnagensis]
MLNVFFSIITSRLTWSFLGITAISLIIWFIGPIISIGDAVPFASISTRVITIISFFFVWLLYQVIPRLYHSWINQKLVKQLNISQDENEENKQKEIYITLAERFSDAAKLLKKAYFAGLYNKNKPSWINFFNRQYIYQLPWYLVIGAPNSGKTTALANSGLHFPLSDYLGKSALYSMQGMDSCNWWFTNKAVLLDTAGRYTAQDSFPQQDADEWQNFIRLLKKYRTRQPLNGVIITISVEDLLNPSTEKRDQQAYILRRRLSELHEQLKIQLPIYVMITKTDLLKGFSAYFSHFDKKSREQIWGFNFPWDKWDKKIDFDLYEIFVQQYSQLQQRLDAELPTILLNGHNSRQCAESYLFPQEFATLHPLIAQYLEIVFAKSGFEIPYYPRGLYFTSGTQEGIPFDNVMEKLNHSFQLPTDNNNNAMSWGNDKGIIHSNLTHETYFLKNLLENIFQEAGIAGCNRWWVYRKRFWGGLGYIISIAILALVTNLLLVSYENNKNYLLKVQEKIPAIVELGDKLNKNSNDIYSLLPILNNLINLDENQSLTHLDKSPFFSFDPPLSYRMGLYSGEQVSSASQSLYKKALQTLLLPQVAAIITDQLRNDNNDDAEKTYNTLKAYQMLYQPKYYDGKFLHDWVMQYLKTHLKADITQEQLQQIEVHIGQLLDNQFVTSPFIRDDSLIEKKRALISRIPPAQRAYNYLKHKLTHDPDLAPVSLDTLAGPQAELVFSRISGAPITDGIPGMFTPAGYQKGIEKNINTFLTTLYSQNNWVLGINTREQTDEEIKSLVKQFYINDYIYQWVNFLADIRLNHIDSLKQRINIARLLSSFDSPMRNLLINLSKNVTLNENSNNDKKLSNLVKSQSDKLTNLSPKPIPKQLTKQLTKQILPNNNQPTPEQEIEEFFSQFIELAKKENQKNQNIPFDKTLKEIGELYQYLISVEHATNIGMPMPPNKIITQLQATAGLLPMPFRNMVSSLVIGASSDTQLSDMKNVDKHFSAEIGVFCNQAIANRYPLMPKSQRDIKPDDMALMFAPKTGLMDSFFQKNLEGKVDTTLPTWQFMPGVNGKPLPGGKTLLKPFQQAQIIRDALFTSGTPTPLFRVMVRPISMDNNILSMTLDVDGQKLEYSHGPQLSQLISWPGPAKTNQVRIQLNLSDGTTTNLSTSGFWALNRLLNHAKHTWGDKAHVDDMSLRAIFNISGHNVSLEFTPSSIFSPFKLPTFFCPSPMLLKAA